MPIDPTGAPRRGTGLSLDVSPTTSAESRTATMATMVIGFLMFDTREVLWLRAGKVPWFTDVAPIKGDGNELGNMTGYGKMTID